MESRIRIIRWLSLLLLSAGMAARAHLLSRYRWFRRPEYPDHYFKKKKTKDIQRTNQLTRITMKIRIHLLQWLSLLQLPVCLGGQSRKPSHFALIRRT
jgi:hypothetical protein